MGQRVDDTLLKQFEAVNQAADELARSIGEAFIPIFESFTDAFALYTINKDGQEFITPAKDKQPKPKPDTGDWWKWGEYAE